MIPRKNNPNKRQNAITGIPIMPIPILPTFVKLNLHLDTSIPITSSVLMTVPTINAINITKIIIKDANKLFCLYKVVLYCIFLHYHHQFLLLYQ